MYFYHNDHLGGTNLVTNEFGQEVERTRYAPFGGILSGGASRNLYTGQEWDSQTGQYYYGARYYNPNLRRFTQADTIIPDVYDPQSLNRYSYVRNNPIKYTDPTGNFYGEGFKHNLIHTVKGGLTIAGGMYLLGLGTVSLAVGQIQITVPVDIAGGLMVADGIVQTLDSASFTVVSALVDENKMNEDQKAFIDTAPEYGRHLTSAVSFGIKVLLGTDKENAIEEVEAMNDIMEDVCEEVAKATQPEYAVLVDAINLYDEVEELKEEVEKEE